MPDSSNQSWLLRRKSDDEIVLSRRTGDDDPAAYTLAFYVALTRDGEPVLTITPSVSSTTITVPFTKAQMTTTLTGSAYYGALWRTDDGSTKPLAVGRIRIIDAPAP